MAEKLYPEKLYLGTRKGLFILSRPRGGKWKIDRVSFLGDPVTIVYPDPRDGAIYAALSLGHFGVKLHRSDDGGKNWTPCAAPAYPTATDGTAGASTEYIWAIEAADPKSPGSLWCGTIPGGLFHSIDGGANWRLIESLWNDPKRKEWVGGGMDKPGIHSICVDPRDSAHVRLGISCGGVWETRDSGETWKCRAEGMIARYMPPDRQADPNIQDPHRLVQSPADPRVLWAQHHNGIFHSTDGSASWKEIESAGPSTFGFAVAAHPTDAKTAWFVPAVKDETRVPVDGKVCVTRTRDGGKSFDVLRKGLPQEHAYHIVFRHALDVREDGNTLAFGSTTGSLWTTEDGGDEWRTFSTDLPPVYCVRFGESSV